MSDEIGLMLQANKMTDLRRFLNNRQCLNTSNIYFTYLFYVVQMVGLLTTSVAQSYNMSNIVWLGIGLNSLATLIHTFEQTNNKLSKHMLDNIISIQNGTYVDEGILIDIDDKSLDKNFIIADV
jgi:pantothenate kinase